MLISPKNAALNIKQDKPKNLFNYPQNNVKLTRRPQTLPEGRKIFSGRVERLDMWFFVFMGNLL